MRRAWLLILLLAVTALAQLPDRSVPLQTVHNTRSLGGLLCQGGRVKTGMVYRSTCLAAIRHTADDMSKVRDLKLSTIIDLRTRTEVRLQGHDPALALQSVALPLPMVVGRSGYRSYLERRGEIHRFFQILSRPESYPVLYHCYEGKDRTGVMTALLLELLGSGRDVIEDDYLQSRRNGYLVDPTWLAAVLETVQQAGGIEAFLGSCGVDRPSMNRVRALLIQAG